MTEMDGERRGLLKFIPPNFSDEVTVLVIESENYLADLRNLMPKARIAFLTTDRDAQIVALCESLKVDLFYGDYARNGLPTEPKIFDIVLAEDCLTYPPESYRTILEINHLLKDSGFMLTQFWNVRFVKVLEELRRGKFPAREKKLWAKWDVVKVLDDAIYKEIRFMPGEQIEKISEVEDWEKFGFDNFSDDLITKIWLVKALKCEAEVAALKEIYTEELRARISRLLHRIEYDLDAEKNLQKLMTLCKREQFFDDYLADFIKQVVVHKDRIEFLKNRAADFEMYLDL